MECDRLETAVKCEARQPLELCSRGNLRSQGILQASVLPEKENVRGEHSQSGNPDHNLLLAFCHEPLRYYSVSAEVSLRFLPIDLGHFACARRAG